MHCKSCLWLFKCGICYEIALYPIYCSHLGGAQQWMKCFVSFLIMDCSSFFVCICRIRLILFNGILFFFCFLSSFPTLRFHLLIWLKESFFIIIITTRISIHPSQKAQMYILIFEMYFRMRDEKKQSFWLWLFDLILIFVDEAKYYHWIGTLFSQ